MAQSRLQTWAGRLGRPHRAAAGVRGAALGWLPGTTIRTRVGQLLRGPRQWFRSVPLWSNAHTQLMRPPLDTRVVIPTRVLNDLWLRSNLVSQQAQQAMNNHSVAALFYSCARVNPSPYEHSSNRS